MSFVVVLMMLLDVMVLATPPIDNSRNRIDVKAN